MARTPTLKKSKKSYSSKNKNRNKKHLLKKKSTRKRKSKLIKSKKGGGDTDALNATIRKKIRDGNLSNNTASSLKSLAGRMMSNNPIVSLLSDPEPLKVNEEQKQIDEQKQAQLEKQVKKPQSTRESMGDQIKGAVTELTTAPRRKGLIASLRDRVSKVVRGTVDKGVDTITGNKKPVPKVPEEVKQIAAERQCDAQYILGLDRLLGTCNHQELVKVYNKVINQLKNAKKKQSYSPNLRKNIEELPELEYNLVNEQKVQLGFNELDISTEDKDLIAKTQKQIQNELGSD